jgi:uncharacterized repeat protein (TIGR03803 family)
MRGCRESGKENDSYMDSLSRGRTFILLAVCGAMAIGARAQKFTTLVNFDGTNGAIPEFMSSIPATNGSFYGTTQAGGANGYGTVFRITPAGVLTTLYNFTGGTDGAYPYGTLIQATNGNLYGTTVVGGITTGSIFDGTVFKITIGGTLTTLHSFAGYPTDGAFPNAGLVQGTDGNFYGTTRQGGANNTCTAGCGTVFKITPSGTLTTLYSFTGGTNGDSPLAVPIQATNGDFYGTTYGIGYPGDYGTVFKMTPSGALTTLHAFTGGSDGAEPAAGLIQGTGGNFYGATYVGANINSACPSGCGTLFKIAPGGTLTTLREFEGPDGAFPDGGLTQATNGSFYGTTSGDGADSDGTVFRLSVGLGPFVKTLPTSGKVGGAVKILGTNLTGATRVTFNGTAAAFTVVSPSLITATVPTGATSGTVQVVTPGGTLVSNVSFRVR